GLVGFHILRIGENLPGPWFFATFEHVDNVEIQDRPVPRGLTPSFNPGKHSPYPTYPPHGYEYRGDDDRRPLRIRHRLLPSAPVNVSFLDEDERFQPGVEE